MRHAAHSCKRWMRRGMQCPFAAFEEEKERSRQDDPEAKATGAAVSADVSQSQGIPWWLAIPLGEGVRRALQNREEIFDVLAAAEEIAAAQARKIPVSATQSLFQVLQPGMEVIPIAGAVAAAGITSLAVRRFGGFGGKPFQANKFRVALQTAN